MNLLRCAASALLLALWLLPFRATAEQGLLYVETADGARSTNTRQLVQWTHARMVFGRDFSRVAVGQSDTMDVEVLGGREVLILAKQVGRTSIIVWYPDNSTETFLFNVVQDLTLLRSALADVHPAISIQLAPDRNALVLRGTVPEIKYKIAAESIAREYLEAGHTGGSVQTVLSPNGVDGLAGNVRLEPAAGRTGSGVASVAVISLLQVETLPGRTEEKIVEAISSLGGEGVRVKRIVRGDIEDDTVDTLLLSGEVPNQVALVRVLNVAARLFLGEESALRTDAIVEVVADESGALLQNQGGGGRGNGGQNGGGQNLGQQLGLGGSAAGGLSNEIRANIGRSKLLSVAGGRILSMIDVLDLPQVRVSVQLHEVNRNRLKTWRSRLAAVTTDYAAASLDSAGSGLIVQPDLAQRVGAAGSSQVENALQILEGTLTNHFQIGGADLAFDLLFSLLETEGISHTLSRPTLTVLAGEDAVFQVGGEVPVPSAFAPDAVTAGVFGGTTFRAFGVRLAIRPMVGEDDRITLDVQPTVSLPDTELTQDIADSSGSSLNTTAFNTRSMETTTRLRDGQTLVLAGLVSRGVLNAEDYTPGLNRIPGFGKLGSADRRSDNDRELIVLVTPTIVREPKEEVALWAFPEAYQLMQSALGLPTTVPSGQD